MRLMNIWLLQSKKKTLLKVVDWAHKNKKLVETLTTEEIQEALRSSKLNYTN